jgi:O-antigen ligase
MPLHKKIFYLLLLFLPTQLSFHFWPEWSYIIGRRIDYLSPTIYITDILIIILLIISFKKKYFKSPRQLKKIFFSLIIILLIFFNLKNSSLIYLTAFKWLKVLEYFLLGLYIYKNINLKKDWENIIKTLSIGIIFGSLLAIAQLLDQSSINGIFYWLGERSFSLSSPNVAKVALNGILILRPYATFPHPNALAGYLAVLLPLILITDFKPMKIKWLAFVLGLTALFLTFSRPAIILGFLGIIVCWIFENFKKRLYLFPLLLIFFIPLLFFIQKATLEKESIDRRISLNFSAIEMFKTNPLFGVGLGNFIPSLPLYSKDKEVIRFLQPCHNIYLLILSETGLMGFIVFITIIIFSVKKLFINKNLTKILILNSLFLILALGLIDHYFITLQQNEIIFTVIVSLALLKYINYEFKT